MPGTRADEVVRRLANGAAGHWIYSVNGIRSPYHIDTQLALGVRTIRFRYVKE